MGASKLIKSGEYKQLFEDGILLLPAGKRDLRHTVVCERGH